MARIFYSMSGEGRGHAARVRSLVEHLRGEHDVTLLAPHDAYDFLAPIYRDTEVEVSRIPGLRFAYRGDRLDNLATAKGALEYVRELPSLVRGIADRLRAERADLVLTDFEPALPRAARRVGLPYVSIDHQHFLTDTDLSSLPLGLRLWARCIAPLVGCYCRGQAATVVSSFYAARPRPSSRDAHHVGVLLRPELRQMTPTREGHVTAYLRRKVPEHVLEVLAGCHREVHLYGLGERARRGAIHFRPVSDRGFLADLASCDAVVSTAGNQLVGEALSLEKPVLAFPEPGNREQEINAHFLDASGAGRAVSVESLGPRVLRGFLDELDAFRARARSRSWDGTGRTLAVLAPFLRGRYAGKAERDALQPALELG